MVSLELVCTSACVVEYRCRIVYAECLGGPRRKRGEQAWREFAADLSCVRRPTHGCHQHVRARATAHRYNNRSVFGILCRVNGSVFPRVLLKALGFGLIGVVALFLHELDPERYSSFWTPESDMHTYMSMMVALLIGFRTNNCYTRYDQGVRISGAMRTHARTLVGQAAAYIALGNDGEGERHIDEIRRLTMLLCLFFKRHMHGEDSGFSTAFSRAVTHITSLQRASRVHGRSASAGTESLLVDSATDPSPNFDESAGSEGAEHQIGEWNGGLSVEEMQRLRTNLLQSRACWMLQRTYLANAVDKIMLVNRKLQERHRACSAVFCVASTAHQHGDGRRSAERGLRNRDGRTDYRLHRKLSGRMPPSVCADALSLRTGGQVCHHALLRRDAFLHR